MTWTDDTWAEFFELLDKGWPGELELGGDAAYRVLLDGTDPEQIVLGLRRLLHQGQRFRPSAAEILGACRRDPSRPTFAEAYRLIFGRGGVLAARPPGGERYRSEHDREGARATAALDRANELHPLVASFVHRQGVERLRGLKLDDSEWGEKRRADLARDWHEHCEAFEGREVAVLAAGGDRRAGLRQIDPLAALAPVAPPAAVLTTTTSDPGEATQ